MKTNELSYNVTKICIENGITYKMNVRISLGDCCKNGVCDWSITADIYENVGTGVSFCVLVVVFTKKF